MTQDFHFYDIIHLMTSTESFTKTKTNNLSIVLVKEPTVNIIDSIVLGFLYSYGAVLLLIYPKG